MWKINRMVSPAFALPMLLSACGEPATNNDRKEATEPPQLIETKEVLPGTLFATFDPKGGYSAMQSASKVACGSEAICKVIIFPPGTVLPTQFPMTDREVSQQIGNYTLNRNSGADELLANCQAVPDAPKNLCAAAD